MRNLKCSGLRKKAKEARNKQDNKIRTNIRREKQGQKISEKSKQREGKKEENR